MFLSRLVTMSLKPLPHTVKSPDCPAVSQTLRKLLVGWVTWFWCRPALGARVVRPRQQLPRGEKSWSEHCREEGGPWPPLLCLWNLLAASAPAAEGPAEAGACPTGPVLGSGSTPARGGHLSQLVLFPTHTPGRVGNEGLF